MPRTTWKIINLGILKPKEIDTTYPQKGQIEWNHIPKICKPAEPGNKVACSFSPKKETTATTKHNTTKSHDQRV